MIKLLSVTALALLACSHTHSDNANSGTPAPVATVPPAAQEVQADQDPQDPADAPSPTPADCVQGDMVKLSLSTDVKACVDQGHIYDFFNKKCTGLNNATTYDCTWDGILAAAGKLRLVAAVQSLTTHRANQSKLVACGEKNQGSTIVVEIWDPVVGGPLGPNCMLAGKLPILTACYDSAEAAVSANATTSEKVAACLTP